MEFIFNYFFVRDFRWFWLLLRAGARVISPFGSRRRATVLIYHHVHRKKGIYSTETTDATEFEWQMKLLKKVFNVISLEEVVQLSKTGDCPSRSISITFDDGYADNYTEALPILKNYQLPATIYVVGDALDHGEMWNETVQHCIGACTSVELDLESIGLGCYSLRSRDERLEAIALVTAKLKPLVPHQQGLAVECIVATTGVRPQSKVMLNKQQLVDLASESLITIGCHTMRHPMLSQIGLPDAEQDIATSRQYIESLIGEPVQHFCYPYGKYGHHFHADHVNLIARLGFDSAVSTDWGTVKHNSSRYMLKRFTPWDITPLRFYLRLCSNFNS